MIGAFDIGPAPSWCDIVLIVVRASEIFRSRFSRTSNPDTNCARPGVQ
jgi:hypothetical protein